MERERTSGPRPAPDRRPAPRGGRPSPRVLLGRWVLVLCVLTAVVTLLVLGVRAVVGALSSDEPVAQPETMSPATCAPDDVEASVTTDAKTYGIGHMATFTITLANVGAAPCTLDGGNIGRELVITSGSDRIWSSADCDIAGAKLLLLAPGNAETQTVAWSTSRSAPGCTTDLPAPRAGTYQAAVTVAGVTSKPAVFALT